MVLVPISNFLLQVTRTSNNFDFFLNYMATFGANRPTMKEVKVWFHVDPSYILIAIVPFVTRLPWRSWTKRLDSTPLIQKMRWRPGIFSNSIKFKVPNAPFSQAWLEYETGIQRSCAAYIYYRTVRNPGVRTEMKSQLHVHTRKCSHVHILYTYTYIYISGIHKVLIFSRSPRYHRRMELLKEATTAAMKVGPSTLYIYIYYCDIIIECVANYYHGELVQANGTDDNQVWA